jgi:hypothetical protein
MAGRLEDRRVEWVGTAMIGVRYWDCALTWCVTGGHGIYRHGSEGWEGGGARGWRPPPGYGMAGSALATFVCIMWASMSALDGKVWLAGRESLGWIV